MNEPAWQNKENANTSPDPSLYPTTNNEKRSAVSTEVSTTLIQQIEKEINCQLIKYEETISFNCNTNNNFLSRQKASIMHQKIKLELLKANAESVHKKQCSFHPKIQSPNLTQYPFEERLYDLSINSRHQALKEELDQQRTERTLSECTFQPKINSNPTIKSKCVNSKCLSQSKNSHYNNNCTFHPKTNKLKKEYNTNPYFKSPSHIRLSTNTPAQNVFKLWKEYGNLSFEEARSISPSFIKRQTAFLSAKDSNINRIKSQQMQGFTFSPRVNTDRQVCSKFEDRIALHYGKKEQTCDLYREKIEKDCTFKPSIVTKKKIGCIIRRKPIKEIKKVEECTFTPIINSYPNIRSKMKTDDPLFMNVVKEEQNQKMVKIFNEQVKLKEKQDSLCTYKPVIHKAPEMKATHVIPAKDRGSYLMQYKNNI